MATGKNKRANGIMERKGKSGELTFYIRYQFNGKDIRERVGRKALGFTRDMAKDALKARLGEIAQGRFSLEKTRKPIPFSQLAERYREYGESASAVGRTRNTFSQDSRSVSVTLRCRSLRSGRSRNGKQSGARK